METSSGAAGWQIALAFVVVAAPVYALARLLVRLARQAYGFSTSEDSGPDHRICAACHNTVMEDDFRHCPYCGAELAPPEPATGVTD